MDIEEACRLLLDTIAKEEGWVGPDYWSRESAIYKNMINGLHHAGRGLLISAIIRTPDCTKSTSPYDLFHAKIVTGTEDLIRYYTNRKTPEAIFQICSEWITETCHGTDPQSLGITPEKLNDVKQQCITAVSLSLGVSNKG